MGTKPAAPTRKPARNLLTCGVIAGPLFIVAFLIEGATRTGYDPMRHPVSSLALGDLGWTQTLNFLICGLLSLAFAVGVRRAQGGFWGPLLIGIWAVATVLAGVFTTDPISGYPAGTPALLTEYSGLPALLHDAVAIPGFAALIIAGLVIAVRFARRRKYGWAAYSAATAVVFATSLVMSQLGFNQLEPWVDHAGLFQRITIVTGLAWLTLLGLYLRRAGFPAPHNPEDPEDPTPARKPVLPHSPAGARSAPPAH
ncbi:DUF998 domain-containing protein [Spongiactinospora gelatinilytica]|uniref:DUF998 domain-containing protein n=1 Tax=Spongiactinospora gelatinilytica TaxID=2666298 RepID=A0A2W2G3J0_9ACTN|nr:DUF998 domain-containing protein [Spongiactinospora gelatinilytica]PZG44476.1 DUF998 domain-containing protein [Spongiactinospora gelatinilytica]